MEPIHLIKRIINGSIVMNNAAEVTTAFFIGVFSDKKTIEAAASKDNAAQRI